ncbi:MAG: hypothetical protein WCP19_09185 [Chloroflexota bacterium]
MNTVSNNKNPGEIQDGFSAGSIPPAPFLGKGEKKGSFLWIFCAKDVRKKSPCGADPRRDGLFSDRKLDGDRRKYGYQAKITSCGADQGLCWRTDEFFGKRVAAMKAGNGLDFWSGRRSFQGERAILPVSFLGKEEKEGSFLWIFCAKDLRKKSNCGADPRCDGLFSDRKLDGDRRKYGYQAKITSSGAEQGCDGLFSDRRLDGDRR